MTLMNREGLEKAAQIDSEFNVFQERIEWLVGDDEEVAMSLFRAYLTHARYNAKKALAKRHVEVPA